MSIITLACQHRRDRSTYLSYGSCFSCDVCGLLCPPSCLMAFDMSVGVLFVSDQNFTLQTVHYTTFLSQCSQLHRSCNINPHDSGKWSFSIGGSDRLFSFTLQLRTFNQDTVDLDGCTVQRSQLLSAISFNDWCPKRPSASCTNRCLDKQAMYDHLPASCAPRAST